MSSDVFNLLKELSIEPHGSFLPNNISRYANKILSKATLVNEFDNHQLVGFLAFYANNVENKIAYLSVIVIDKNYRRMGLARKLLTKAVEMINNLDFKYFDLHVSESNNQAIDLYTAHNFKIVDKLDGKLLMRKTL